MLDIENEPVREYCIFLCLVITKGRDIEIHFPCMNVQLGDRFVALCSGARVHMREHFDLFFYSKVEYHNICRFCYHCLICKLCLLYNNNVYLYRNVKNMLEVMETLRY